MRPAKAVVAFVVVFAFWYAVGSATWRAHRRGLEASAAVLSEEKQREERIGNRVMRVTFPVFALIWALVAGWLVFDLD